MMSNEKNTNYVEYNCVNYDLYRKLTITEYMAVVETIVDSCFDAIEYVYNENGEVIGIAEEKYNPMFKYIQSQIVLSKYFTDIELDKSLDILEKYNYVSNVDIQYISMYNCQVRDLLNVVDMTIDERIKTNELSKNNKISDTIGTMVEEIVRTRLETEQAQAKSMEIMNTMSNEEYIDYIKGITEISKIANNKDSIKELAKLVHKENVNETKKPQDHKKKQNKVVNLNGEEKDENSNIVDTVDGD